MVATARAAIYNPFPDVLKHLMFLPLIAHVLRGLGKLRKKGKGQRSDEHTTGKKTSVFGIFADRATGRSP